MGFDDVNLDRKSYAARVSVDKGGNVNLNRPVLEVYGLEDTGMVKLLFDQASRRLAVLPAQDDDPGAVRLRRKGANPGASFSARRILDKHHIPFRDGTRKCEIVAVQDMTDVLVIDLKW